MPEPSIASAPAKAGGLCVTFVDATQARPADGGLSAEDRWWSPLVQRWPGYAGTPVVQVLTPIRVIGASPEMLGAVVLIATDDLTDPDLLYAMVDALWEWGHSGIVLVPAVNERNARLGGRGVIVMSESENLEVVAAALHAMGERQSAIASLQTELRIARRFQGGLRGEMDKIHDELQLAASVQRELLPRSLPTLTNVAFQVLFRPAGYVSGDIYDVQQLDEFHVAFFIADAVGHGVPAALMTMLLSRSLSLRNPDEAELFLSPSVVLERLNRDMISRHSDVPRFATAVYGVIDCRDRSVVIASAGHPRPLRIRGGEITQVETEGGLLGVFPEDTFDETKFQLAEDEMLLLFSDGFETAFPDPQADQYGRKVPTRRFLDSFTESALVWRDRGGAAAMAGIAQALDQQQGSLHQIDDLTALMVVPTHEHSSEVHQSGRAAA